MSRTLPMLCMLSALLAGSPAFGAAIGFTPSQQSASDGDLVSVDIVVSGLGNGASPAVGSFDLDVLFDPVVLAFQSYSIGAALGLNADDTDLEHLNVGLIDLAAVSLEDPADLIADQGSSVSLARLDFRVLSLPVGASTRISIDTTDTLLFLGDEGFASLTITTFSSASIVNPQTGVPAPQTWLLVGLGLGLLRVSTQRIRAASSP